MHKEMPLRDTHQGNAAHSHLVRPTSEQVKQEGPRAVQMKAVLAAVTKQMGDTSC